MHARSGFVMSCSPSRAHSSDFRTARRRNYSSPLNCGARDDCEPIQNKPDPSRRAQASDGSAQSERKAGNDRE